MSKEAMKLALEASKDLCTEFALAKVREILEEALAKQEQGEPVAWRLESGKAVWFERTDPEASSALPNDVTAIPLYAAPQQRTAAVGEDTRRAWVGLTDREKSNLWLESRAAIPRFHTYATLVEAKIKEKNT
jgi:hypothetical protein